jgi:predicted ATPase/DNA-binding winged helix-turn-helix (wHTH) protein
LGERAFDVLAVLAKAAGEVVSKDDLMALVWRSSIVEENALQAHISAIRRALGADRDILRTIAGRGYSLQPILQDLGRLEDHSTSHVNTLSPSIAKQHQGNLPAATSALFGRVEAVSNLKAMLSQSRAVTVTGPGGIGKTALSLAVARELSTSHQIPSYLVDLAPVIQPALVASGAASAVGLSMGAEAVSAELVATRIGASKILLLLDNCEHLISEVASFVASLLKICPHVTLLATSREPLRVEGEHVYRLPPLTVPAPEVSDPQSIYASASVELFVDRMRAADSAVILSPDQASGLATICRRLDGIPLALEFAAARAAAVGVAQVAENLNDRFKLLTGGRRTSLPRQQTLRATLDWSYDLLPPPEQVLLRHLGVFPGGFTVDAAAAVMGDTGANAVLVLEGIANLVSKSLVVVDRLPGRWRLLETIRSYAMERLVESGEWLAAARRQAQFLFQLFSSSSTIGLGQLNKSNVDRFVAEIDNVRAALDWCFSADGDAATGVALTAAYSPTWQHLSLMAECGDRVGLALERRDPRQDKDDRLLMQLSLQQGVAFGYAFQSHERTQRAAETALRLAERLSDVPTQLQARHLLFSTNILSGNVDASLPIGTALLAIAQQSGSDFRIATAERLMGFAHQMKGDLGRAQALFEAALARAPLQETSDYSWARFNERAMSRAMLAKVLWLRGDTHRAVVECRRALEEAATEPYAATRCNLLRHALCRIEMMTGDLEAATRSIALLKDLSTRFGYRVFGMASLCLEGALLIKRGDFEAGVPTLRASLATCMESGWTAWFTEFLAILAEGLMGLGQYEEATAVVAQAFERSARGGEDWYLPELYRLRGQLALCYKSVPEEEHAEQCYRRSLDLSIAQGALFWKLRAAFDLAQLKKRQNQLAEAADILRPVYGGFPSDINTPDLQSARGLLNSLQ